MSFLTRVHPFITATFIGSFVVLFAVMPAPAAEPDRGSSLPSGVPADWWSQVQRSIQLEEYAVVSEDMAGTEFRAANPAQRFEGRFGVDGLRLASTEGTSWEWGLSLISAMH